MKTDKKGDRIGAGKSNDAVVPKGGNASERDRIEAATAAQSSVTPEDYTEEERSAQVAAATGKPLRD
jgi:hypothetical protein